MLLNLNLNFQKGMSLAVPRVIVILGKEEKIGEHLFS